LEWLSDYFKIFGDWFRNGADKGLETSYNDIVIKILQLNKAHKNIPLAFQANEFALKCEMAYAAIGRMETALLERLNGFAWHHRLAVRMTTLVIKKINPDAANIPGYIVRKRISLFSKLSWHPFPDFDLAAVRTRKRKPLVYGVLFVLFALSILSVFRPFAKARQKSPPVVDSTQRAIPLSGPLLLDSSVERGLRPSPGSVKTLPGVFTRSASFVYGIDISRYQGNLLEDIDSMDSLHFVICKATEGKKYVDPDFATNWAFIRKKRLVRGAYHFYLTNDDPVRQAEHFLGTINGFDSTDMPPVIDVEDGSIVRLIDTVTLKVNLLLMLRYIEQATGRKPLIYTDLDFADKYLVNNSFADYPLWLAEYSGNAVPRLPVTWKRKGYVIWQKKDSYRIDSKRTDFDIFNGSGDKMIQFIMQR
jgi:GH25 family lysozyme M1 (1,4-beta-N-acetylmuramidase)